jgi:hypothetical protein
MDTVTLQQIRDLLQKNNKIAIAVGSAPSVDDMAAALSLYLSLSQLNKSVSIASPDLPLVEHSSLVGIDRVKTQLEGGSGGDLVVSFPYREGEIEKVSYTIDNGYLNIVVKAGEQGLTFQERDVVFKRGGGAPAVLVVVGTPRLSDLGNLFNPDELKDTTVVNIDNKNDNQGYGDMVLVSPQFSSVSELMANILMQLGIDPDIDIAQNLLSGIAFATNNLQSTGISYTTFEVIAALMRKGAVMQAPRGAQAPRVQSEDRVSSFMPEQMRAASPTNRANAIRQQLAQQAAGQQAPAEPGNTNFGAQQPRENNQNRGNAQPQNDRSDRKPPSDWLTPKVYKGSQTPIE